MKQGLEIQTMLCIMYPFALIAELSPMSLTDLDSISFKGSSIILQQTKESYETDHNCIILDKFIRT